eukprot:RCo047482
MGVVVSVPAGSLGVIEKNGQFSHIVGPGTTLVLPCVTRLAGVVTMGERRLVLEAEGTTREFAFVRCNVSVWYKLMEDSSGGGGGAGSNSSAYRAFYKAENDPEPRLREIVGSILKSQIRGYTLAKIFSKGEDIARTLQEEASSEMHQYGFLVVNVTLGDIRSEQGNAPTA